jgi:hypothetical protein
MDYYIKLEDLQKFPIRSNNYDKKHGNENFVFGVESVLEYAEYLPRYTISNSGVVCHGEWLTIDDGVDIGDGTHIECSNCGTWSRNKNKTQYCSYCGAYMLGGIKQ